MQVSHTPIRVATLRGDAKIPFDVFVKVGDRYVLYCRRGDSFEGTRLSRLRMKKLRKMYVLKSDEVPYRQYLEENINHAYDKSGDRALSIRAEIIQGFQQAETESFFEDALDAFTYANLRSSVQRFTEFIETEPDGLKALLEIPNSDLSITQHSVNVAALAVALVLELNLREGTPLHLLALGCLLHDIEHFFDPNFDLQKPLKDFSEDEKAEYREHPLKGAHRLQGGKFLDQIVLNVITQHEELADGTGFPKGLRDKEMDPLVPLANLANAYEHAFLRNTLPIKDFLKKFLIDYMGVYPLEHMQALQTILKRHGLV